MSQDSIQVAPHSSGINLREGFNKALVTLATLYAGPAQPNPIYPHMLWLDTQNNKVWQAKADVSGFIQKGVVMTDGTIQWLAGAVVNTPNGSGITSTDIQAAINELDTKKIGVPANVALGDILYFDGTKFTRLPAGSAGQVLQMVGTAPGWSSTAGGGSPGVTGYIADGRKMSPGTGLQLNITAGKDAISGATVNFATNQLTLPARMAMLAYDKNDGASGVVSAAFPEPDANTIVQYRPDGSANVPNYAVGKSPLAVANDLLRTGGVTPADGWCGGYAAQGDGTSGYYGSSNNTNFPIGSSVREIDVLVTVLSNPSTAHYLISFGTSSASNYEFSLVIRSGLNVGIGINNTASIDTGYTLEIGKTYLLSACYDGTNVILKVNGTQVFSQAQAINTQAGNLNIFRWLGGSNYSLQAIHFVELRNTLRTPTQFGTIANKLCLPCRYTGSSGSYPTIAAGDLAGYHEWRFAETSGTAVADSNTTTALNGTAIGTTIVNSDIISGAKARKFNGSSDVVSVGSYAFTSSFTVIGVVNLASITGWQSLLGNYNGTNGNIFCLAGNSTGKLAYSSGGNWIYSNGTMPLNIPTFVAFSNNGGQVTFYINSAIPDSTATLATYTTAQTLQIGSFGNSTSFLNGTIDYLAIIPRALSQAEITQIYNTLIKQADRTIIDDMLSADTISLGYIRTGSSGIAEYVDSSDPKGKIPDYAYGVRFGAFEGNRKKFLGWKYFSGAATLTWDNPFGTRKIKTYYTWAQDAMGMNESDTLVMFSDSSSRYYGIRRSGVAASKIQVDTYAYGVCTFNGVNQTSGYLGCYAEVIE